MKLRISELRDPARLMQEVADRITLEDEHAYLVLVEDPSTTQELRSITELRSPATIDSYEDVSEELQDTVDTLRLSSPTGPPRHMVVTVLVRRGLCVHGPLTGEWMSAWRYSHHAADVWDGQVIMVTEHGWCDFMTDLAGLTPALAV